MRRAMRRAARSWQVFSVVMRVFVLSALPFRRGRRMSRPERMRSALEQLGGAWVKLGQMLAMRFDLMPPEYCEELLKLLNAVPPFSYAEVTEIVRQELGAAPDRVFRAFEPKPFASASIGQVHRAVLPSGERVAVKVQRPRIRETMRADIDLMYSLTWLLDWTHVFGATSSHQVIDEFARWTADELDYLVEARQAVLLYEHVQGDNLERIAHVYRSYTTSRVLTSELIVGIPLIDIVVAVRGGDEPYLSRLRTRGYDLEQIVRHLDWNMLNQVFVFGTFHADLHPANLYVLPGNAIGYVDFGMVGQLRDDVRDSLTRYSWLLFQWDVESAVKELMRWLAATATTDTAAARQQLVRLHDAFLYAVGTVGEPPGVAASKHPDQPNPYSTLAVGIMDTVRRNQLVLSPSIVAFLKMLMTLGMLRHQLATDYDLPEVARRFFGRLVQQQAQAWLDPHLAIGRVYEASFRVKRALEFFEFLEAQQPLLSMLTGTAFGVQFRLQGLKRWAQGIGVAIMLLGVLLFFTLADPGTASSLMPGPIPFEILRLGLLTVLILAVLAFIQVVRMMTRN